MRSHWTQHLRGQSKQRGKMNKLETAYAVYLAALRAAGKILWYEYEAVSLRLADGARYTPDFLVMRADGTLECHEVKGFWAEAARLRIKVAADRFPFRFVAATKAKAGWSLDDFS